MLTLVMMILLIVITIYADGEGLDTKTMMLMKQERGRRGGRKKRDKGSMIKDGEEEVREGESKSEKGRGMNPQGRQRTRWITVSVGLPQNWYLNLFVII